MHRNASTASPRSGSSTSTAAAPPATSLQPAEAARAHDRKRSGLVGAVALTLAASLALTPVSAAWAAPAGTAGAASVEVLALSSNDAVDEAAALTDAFRRAIVGAPGVVDHGKTHALEAVALTAGCDDPMAAACAPKIAGEIKHDKFIYGTVKKTAPNKVTATLTYYNAGQSKTVAKTYDAGPIAKDGASPELKKVALDALMSLLGGAPKAKVEVTVTGPAGNENGELFENGQSLGGLTAGKGVVDLPNGTHTLELRVKGYAASTSTIEVTTGGASVQFAPVKLEPPKPIDWQLYGGIAAVGVGLVFVGLGVSSSLDVKNAQDNATFDAYRRRWGKSESDTCARAREGKEGPNTTVAYKDKLAADVASICDGATSSQTAQYVYYGLGGALAITGAVLIGTDKGAPKDTGKDKTAAVRVEVRPVVSPGYSSLSLVGSF